MDDFSTIKNSKILIDTNILIYYSVKRFQDNSRNVLRRLIDGGNQIAISAISGLELLRDEEDTNKRKYYLNLLNFIKNIDVSHAVLQNAHVLSQEYHKILRGKKAPLVDLILGGTAIGRDTLLLTADKKDFCEPIWRTISHEYVFTDVGKKDEVMHNLYLKKYDSTRAVRGVWKK